MLYCIFLELLQARFQVDFLALVLKHLAIDGSFLVFLTAQPG